MSAVLENADTVAEAIRSTLDRFVIAAEPAIRKVSEAIYEDLLNTVQDYLRENGEWNIGQEIERCRRIETENRQLRQTSKKLVEAFEYVSAILGAAESNASGNPEWDSVSWRINAVREAVEAAKATGHA